MSIDQLETQKSYYELLEVKQDASDEEIKRAYRRLALQNHPDRARTFERRAAEQRFRQINEAYAHLKTPEKRAAYNDVLKAQNDNANKNSSFWDSIAAIFVNPANAKSSAK